MILDLTVVTVTERFPNLVLRGVVIVIPEGNGFRFHCVSGRLNNQILIIVADQLFHFIRHHPLRVQTSHRAWRRLVLQYTAPNRQALFIAAAFARQQLRQR